MRMSSLKEGICSGMDSKTLSSISCLCMRIGLPLAAALSRSRHQRHQKRRRDFSVLLRPPSSGQPR